MHGDDGFEGAAELCGYEGGETLLPLVGHERDASSEGERAFALLRFATPAQARRSLEVVLPYRHAQDEGGFAIHRPKVIRAVGLPETLEPVIRTFYRGLDAHEDGKISWTRHLDLSA